MRGDVHQRRGLGRVRARHRHPPQQHDGRGGPLAARLLHPPAGAAAAVDDGSHRRQARRRGDARARLRRLQPHPLGDPAGDPRRDRPRARPPPAVEAPRVHWEEGVVYAEPGAEAEGWPRAGRWRTSPTSTCSSEAPRPCAATPPPASWSARATRAAAARSSWPEGLSDGRRVGRRVPDDQLGRQHDIRRRAAFDRLEQHAPRGAALLDERLPNRGEPARRGAWDVVEAHDGEVVRKVEPRGGARRR